MSQIVSFTVPMIPRAQGRPRFARMGKFVRTYKDSKTEQAERDFISFAAEHAPERPLEGPLYVVLSFFFPVPTTWPKWRRDVLAATDGTGFYHRSRPDVDNLCKLVLDALNRTGRFWKDDAQIAVLRATKWISDPPKTHVMVSELVECDRDHARAIMST